MKNTFTKLFQKLFAIDYRALAIFRIGMGSVLLYDTLWRLPAVVAFFSDEGIIPRETLISISNTSQFSLHFISGTPSFQIALILIQAFFACTLIIGYKTRLSTIISWILLISVHARNPFLLNGGDYLFRCLFLWAMFLPLHKYLSLDALLSTTEYKVRKSFLSVAGIALLLQAALLYFFTGVLKIDPSWQIQHDALTFALMHDQFATDFGQWLLQFPQLLEFGTVFALYLEIIGAVALFIPVATARIRIIIFFLFTALQIGINTTMHHIEIFGVVTTLALIPFLPPLFFDNISDWIRKFGRQGLTIYYDGDCGICKKIVHTLFDICFLHKDTAISPASQQASIQQKMIAHNSWVVVDQNAQEHFRFTGVCVVFLHSPLFSWLVPVLRIKPIYSLGQWLYTQIAFHRHTVCLPESEIKSPREKVFSILGKTLAGILLLYMILINVRNYDTEKYNYLVPDTIRTTIASSLYLNQYWAMFAPKPSFYDGWHVTVAVLEDGQQFNIFTGGAGVNKQQLSYEKPEDVSRVFANRWMHYFFDIRSQRYAALRKPYAEYLCREWKKKYPSEPLAIIKLNFVEEKTQRDYTIAPPHVVNFYTHTCAN